MRRAARTDANQSAVADAFRRLGCSVLSLASMGKGVPDLLCANARLGSFLVEVKDGSKPPSERKLTDDQIAFHRTWPVEIFIVKDVGEVPGVIQTMAGRA